MPTNVSTQFKESGNLSFRATAAVIGRRFLAISGNRTGGPGLSTDLENLYRMAHCGAGQRAVGVSKYDVALNKTGGVHGQPGMIVEVEAGAALVAGAKVMSGLNGKAVPWVSAVNEANECLGVAMTAAAGDTAIAEIKLYV